MEVIHSRSPYFVTTSASNLVRATLEIYIYEGRQELDRLEATFSLNSTPVFSTMDIRWNISDLIYAEIDKRFSSSDFVWVDYRVLRQEREAVVAGDYINCYATLGYGYYEQGYNPSFTSNIPLSVDTIYKNEYSEVTVPINTLKDGSVTFTDINNNTDTFDFLSSDLSQDIINYYTSFSLKYYKQRVIDDGGTYEGSSCLDSFFDEYELSTVKSVSVKYDDGEESSIKVVDICENKYTPYRVYFINKYGVKEEFWFFKKSKLSMKTSKDSYKLNNINRFAQGDLTSHSNIDFNFMGSEKLMMNSGWVLESFNETFRQMMLSERIWMDYEGKVLPVNVKGESIDYKTVLNDKLINYEISVDFSFNKINDIR